MITLGFKKKKEEEELVQDVKDVCVVNSRGRESLPQDSHAYCPLIKDLGEFPKLKLTLVNQLTPCAGVTWPSLHCPVVIGTQVTSARKR